MDILVIGSGGREHALTWAIAQSPLCHNLFIAPGNGGTYKIATNINDLDVFDNKAVLEFVRTNNIDLVVIGPEAPLVAGLADVLRKSNILVFGPDSQGALLEGSKSYSKKFMIDNNIPTANYAVFDNRLEAHKFCDKIGTPLVIKADGLAAGKGVTVAQSLEEAHNAIDKCFDGAFGKAGTTIVIEEMLEGFECSLLAFVSNGKAFCMTTAQDHKRAYDGDLGPNTGGMGVYSPIQLISKKDFDDMVLIMEKAAYATSKEPFTHDYRGCLYGGFMVTPQGPKVLEFNVRFGDPETQVIVPRLDSDLLEILIAIAQGKTDEIDLKWVDDCAVCVVLASKGYPLSYDVGKEIKGLDRIKNNDNVIVFHAGTAIDDNGKLITAGGRVLDVVGLGNTIEEARENVYSAIDKIEFEGKQYRTDIAYHESK